MAKSFHVFFQKKSIFSSNGAIRDTSVEDLDTSVSVQDRTAAQDAPEYMENLIHGIAGITGITGISGITGINGISQPGAGIAAGGGGRWYGVDVWDGMDRRDAWDKWDRWDTFYFSWRV